MKSRREEDQELVDLAQTGDVHAFELLMQRYKSRLARYLSRYMHDPDDTEDVVQETFIKAYLGINNFRGEAAFSTWIFRIGINNAQRSLAKRKRQGQRFSDAGGEDPDDRILTEAEADFDTPEAKLETKEFLDLLDATLAGLPEEQRISFELRELEGLTYEEIAWEMQCPVGTVRSRIHRARDTLAAALKLH